jgi:hypothetical protein
VSPKEKSEDARKSTFRSDLLQDRKHRPAQGVGKPSACDRVDVKTDSRTKVEATDEESEREPSRFERPESGLDEAGAQNARDRAIDLGKKGAHRAGGWRIRGAIEPEQVLDEPVQPLPHVVAGPRCVSGGVRLRSNASRP